MVRLFRTVASLLVALVLFVSCVTSPSTTAPDTETDRVASLPDPAVAVAPAIEMPPEPDVEDVYGAISASVVLGDIDGAIRRFEEAFSEDPDDAATKVLYAGLQMAAGELEAARATLDDVLASEPGNADALYHLALIEGIEGNEEAERRLLLLVLDTNPEDARALAGLGEIALRRERINEAIDFFTRSISSDPENLVARVGYGSSLMAKKRYRDAVGEFDRATEIDPEYPFAYVDRSRAKIELDDYPGAEADLTRAIELVPDYYWNYVDRGRVRLLGSGDALGALDDFNRAIELDPSYFYPYIYRGVVLDQLDRRTEAIADYERVVTARPDYYYAYEPLGLLYYIERRFLDAVPWLEKTYELNRSDPAYPLLITVCYLRAGRESAAEAYMKRAITAIPRDGLQYHLARLFLEPGYDANVTALLNRENDREVKTRMLYYLAIHYLLHDRVSLAQKYFLEVEDRGYPGMIEYRLARVELEAYREAP